MNGHSLAEARFYAETDDKEEGHMTEMWQEAIDELLAQGKVEVVGERNGEPLYQITAAGQARMRYLLDAVLESAATEFSEKLNVPRWLARDLILRHARELAER